MCAWYRPSVSDIVYLEVFYSKPLGLFSFFSPFLFMTYCRIYFGRDMKLRTEVSSVSASGFHCHDLITFLPNPSWSFFSVSYPGDLGSAHTQVVLGFLIRTEQNSAFFICVFCAFLWAQIKLQIINMFLIMILFVCGWNQEVKIQASSYFSLWVVTEMVRYSKEVRKGQP